MEMMPENVEEFLTRPLAAGATREMLAFEDRVREVLTVVNRLENKELNKRPVWFAKYAIQAKLFPGFAESCPRCLPLNAQIWEAIEVRVNGSDNRSGKNRYDPVRRKDHAKICHDEHL